MEQAADLIAALTAHPSAAEPVAKNAPLEAIGKVLADLMEHYVSNGANSVSMPDECVEVAAWLCGVKPNPAHSPESRDEVRVPREPTRIGPQYKGHAIGYEIVKDWQDYADALRALLAAAISKEPMP